MKISALALTAALFAAALPAQAADFTLHPSQKPQQLNGKAPVQVINFWATWCGPCQLVGPHIEKLAHEYEGKAVIGKCDVDRDQELPSRFGIRNIPTILFIKNGELVNKIVGAQDYDTLKKAVDAAL